MLTMRLGQPVLRSTWWGVLGDLLQAIDDMDLPGLRLHELSGDRKGIWSVTVNGNWRVTFRFIGRDAEIVNYEDYH